MIILLSSDAFNLSLLDGIFMKYIRDQGLLKIVRIRMWNAGHWTVYCASFQSFIIKLSHLLVLKY